jgi:hypothetical protein
MSWRGKASVERGRGRRPRSARRGLDQSVRAGAEARDRCGTSSGGAAALSLGGSVDPKSQRVSTNRSKTTRPI